MTRTLPAPVGVLPDLDVDLTATPALFTDTDPVSGGTVLHLPALGCAHPRTLTSTVLDGAAARQIAGGSLSRAPRPCLPTQANPRYAAIVVAPWLAAAHAAARAWPDPYPMMSLRPFRPQLQPDVLARCPLLQATATLEQALAAQAAAHVVTDAVWARAARAVLVMASQQGWDGLAGWDRTVAADLVAGRVTDAVLQAATLELATAPSTLVAYRPDKAAGQFGRPGSLLWHVWPFARSVDGSVAVGLVPAPAAVTFRQPAPHKPTAWVVAAQGCHVDPALLPVVAALAARTDLLRGTLASGRASRDLRALTDVAAAIG